MGRLGNCGRAGFGRRRLRHQSLGSFMVCPTARSLWAGLMSALKIPRSVFPGPALRSGFKDGGLMLEPLRTEAGPVGV